MDRCSVKIWIFDVLYRFLEIKKNSLELFVFELML